MKKLCKDIRLSTYRNHSRPVYMYLSCIIVHTNTLDWKPSLLHQASTGSLIQGPCFTRSVPVHPTRHLWSKHVGPGSLSYTASTFISVQARWSKVLLAPGQYRTFCPGSFAQAHLTRSVRVHLTRLALVCSQDNDHAGLKLYPLEAGHRRRECRHLSPITISTSYYVCLSDIVLLQNVLRIVSSLYKVTNVCL